MHVYMQALMSYYFFRSDIISFYVQSIIDVVQSKAQLAQYFWVN